MVNGVWEGEVVSGMWEDENGEWYMGGMRVVCGMWEGQVVRR